MNQNDQSKDQKKEWEKPQLFNLSVGADTKTGGAGPSVDWSNTTTATNTKAS